MVKSLIPPQRHDRIRSLPHQQRLASIAELSTLLRVSKTAIRRDLALLAQAVTDLSERGMRLLRTDPRPATYG